MTGITSTTPPEAQVRDLIRARERAIQSGDVAGVLDRHANDVLMFDVPEPMRSLCLGAYHQTWELLFRYNPPGPTAFVIDDLRVTAGDDVAFASGLLRIGGSAAPVCRLTLGLQRRHGRWSIVHEHHSAPRPLEPKPFPQ
jgi:ketosteroid isomerase-like protein